MLGNPLDTYGSCIVMLGTNMHFMQKYLDRALESFPEISEQIQKLKHAYEKENEALQRLINFQGGYFFDADRNAILNKDYRVQLAAIIRQVGQCYEEAANAVK